jgi:prephenate dehydratase
MVREVRSQPRHQLLTRPDVTLEQITKSFARANAQCRIWLRRTCRDGRPAASSTANAVERVARATVGAIENQLAEPRTGAWCWRRHRGPQDSGRFILGRQRRQDWFEPYKTSLVCEIVRISSVLLILQEFAFRRINLTKIESRPSKRRLGDYLFLVDMEGKVDDGPVADALRCLRCKLPRLTVLGSYPVGRPLAFASRP